MAKSSRYARLQGTPAEHGISAETAIADALRHIKKGACFEGLLALGAASAHIDESFKSGTALLKRWDKASTAFNQTCLVRRR